jgi:hypothetical protein
MRSTLVDRRAVLASVLASAAGMSFGASSMRRKAIRSRLSCTVSPGNICTGQLARRADGTRDFPDCGPGFSK